MHYQETRIKAFMKYFVVVGMLLSAPVSCSDDSPSDSDTVNSDATVDYGAAGWKGKCTFNVSGATTDAVDTVMRISQVTPTELSFDCMGHDLKYIPPQLMVTIRGYVGAKTYSIGASLGAGEVRFLGGGTFTTNNLLTTDSPCQIVLEKVPSAASSSPLKGSIDCPILAYDSHTKVVKLSGTFDIDL